VIAVDGQNRLYASDSNGIKVLKPDGSVLAGIYEGLPTGLAIDEQGALFFTAANTVKKAQLTGQ
jgi:sugar lactone lactonase YvrE